MKLLYARSGNRCAFPGCGVSLVVSGADGSAQTIGMAAHIVASARQGPRGAEPISDIDRDRRASNRVLLCPNHHAVVDKELTIYSVEVMRQIKIDHETSQAAAPAPDPALQQVAERLHLSVLPVIGLPSWVASASLRRRVAGEGEIARSLSLPPQGSSVVFPFIVRESRLWSFADLRDGVHPFAEWIDSDIEVTDVASMLGSEEGSRRFVTLLNRGLGRHLGALGVRFDREHQRYWFLQARDGGERRITYTTKGGRISHKPVVHHARRKSGEEKAEWFHEAARLRFERFGDSWVLTVRPEFHITLDGREAMPAHRIGRKVTRKKSHLYNAGYLDRLFFWRHFLTDGGPRLVVKAGEQSIVIDGVYASVAVEWPGVPEDSLTVSADRAGETLFSLADLEDDNLPEAWLHDDEDGF